MVRRISSKFGPCDSVLFLALRWGGGTARTLADLIGLYDWVNRAIPTAEELDGGLNRLLAAGLIATRRDGYYIPAKVIRRFDLFRRQRRHDRFDMAERFARLAGPLHDVPRRVTIRRADQKKAYEDFSQRFAATWKKLAGKD